MSDPHSAQGERDHCPWCGEGYGGRDDAAPGWQAYDVLRDLVSAYMAGDDLGPIVNRAEDLTGGQQNGS